MDNRQGSESMSPLDLFVRDLDERKGKIPCCQEVTYIQTGVEKILKALLLEVEKEYPFLKTTLINSGSFYEGTKVGQPDEFDYFVQLDYFSEPEAVRVDELPCATIIVIPSQSADTKLRKLRFVSKPAGFDWKVCVKTPFVRTLNDKAKGLKADGIKVLSLRSKRHGPAYCLELEWTGGERYRGLKISVDLSLAVKINSPSSTMDVDLETPAGRVIKSCLLPYFFAVSTYDHHLGNGCPRTPPELFDRFKASDLVSSATKTDICLRCSQSCLEQELFRHFGSDGGPTVCLRVLKVLRDMLFPNIDDVKEFVFNDVNIVPSFLAEYINAPGLTQFREWINVQRKQSRNQRANRKAGYGSKWISSYALKTLVLFEWEQNPADEQWSGSNLSDRLLNILQNLRLLYLKDELSNFFYRDHKIRSPCCQFYDMETAIIGRITTVLSLLLSIREATDEYNFEECLRNMLEDLKWI